jgi:hypothetical protein
MSILPYTPVLDTEPMDITPFLFGMGVIFATMLVHSVDDTIPQDNVEEEHLQTDEVSAQPEIVPIQSNTPIVKGNTRLVSENPVDSIILEVLTRIARPITVRDLVHLVEGLERKQLNSRLYTLYSKKMVKKCDTATAPLWFV